MLENFRKDFLHDALSTSVWVRYAETNPGELEVFQQLPVHSEPEPQGGFQIIFQTHHDC